MTTTISHRLNAVSKGFVLAAMLASASALAETPTGAADEARWQRAEASAAGTGAADFDETLPRKKAALNASRKAPPARVFLEDYERVHKQVNYKYPTEIYWVGKGAQAK